MEGRYAYVIIDISHEKVDRPFQYLIPRQLQGLVKTGSLVTVPFGAGNHERQGYVIEITDRSEFPEGKLKQLTGIVENTVKAEGVFIELAAWMRQQYGSTMITALKTVLPVKKMTKQLEKKSIRLLLSDSEAEAFLALCIQKNQTAKARVIEALCQEKEQPLSLITGKLHISSQTIKSLEKQEIIALQSENIYRNPALVLENNKDARAEHYGQKKILSTDQMKIAERIIKRFNEGIKKTSLIHGITGSGKTEVYLELIEEMIRLKKQTIVLIPEIALTYQTLLRFYKRFGNQVSVMNSSLSQGERYDQWVRAKQGEISVMIGPRSALFTPFSNLGLIIIDEEHETSYKNETMPRYHAREAAEKIAQIHKAAVVLGSATPSLEAYYRAKNGVYDLYELNERQAGGELPEVTTVDLREELKAGNRSIFSRKLRELMEERLRNKEQIILFLNRRGYAGFISCRSCGHVMKCPHCDVSLSEHNNGRLICHYCGYQEAMVSQCPECGSPYIMGFRAGTQQIQRLLEKEFPQAGVLRMDADTTRTKESYESILTAFSNGEADILLGTQMIVKGHDFPNVTLVGILAADLSLHICDYRASERTFQLLTQAAGRAGRGSSPGAVVIQTYAPEHYSVVHAANQDYLGFYEEEILYRELMGYPPASHMMVVLAASPDEERAGQLALELLKAGSRAEKITEKNREVTAMESEQGENAKDHIDMGGDHPLKWIGPAPAAISKINDIYRMILYVKCNDYEALIRSRTRMEEYMEEQSKEGRWKKELVQFDFDPVHTY